jgi:L-ascorbate metabolism protein UlaG (beta-lactamase superfamily)
MKKVLTIIALLGIGFSYAQTDTYLTEKGDLKVTPVYHSSMVLEWNNLHIWVDPYGGAHKYESFATPELILITDIHGDHLHMETLEALDLSKTELIAPSAVVEKLGDVKFKKVYTLANDEKQKWKSLKVEAIPMYNLPETEDSRHPKGRGNGYVLSLGGKRVYISGDTEDTKEMRALKDIDIAFVCMNLPYTMSVDQAVSAVLEFKPKVVYPFHYRGANDRYSSVAKFKIGILKDSKMISVVVRDWY